MASNSETTSLAYEIVEPTHIVGVGASAGGLEALERMFASVPPLTGMAFVVVQHLSPDFRSLMDELLARWTHMKIYRVTHGLKVEPNTIYLIPPKKEMVISQGRLLLEDKDPDQVLSLPIDNFLKSLAGDRGRTAIAVILSGTGSDGSRGVEEIKRSGGLVITQSEQSAKFDGMPHSARETGSVDLTLDPEDIGPALVRFAQGVEPPKLAAEFGNPGVEEDGLSRIYRLLRDRFGIDFSFYKLNTIVRRTERRLQLSHIDTIQEYARRLADDPDELDWLYRDLLVGVTRFFRDAEAYRQLEHHVDSLLKTKQYPDEFRAWVAGCATGEEAYSIAILLTERMRASGKTIPIRVFATDVHQRSLVIAGAGVYRAESVSELSPHLLATYFKRVDEGYVLSDEIRHLVVFATHNIIKDSPFTRMDLISCRNLLIYLQPAAQNKALSLFHFGLRTGGALFLGPSESLGELEPEFEVIDQHWKLYSKRRDVRLPIELRTPANLVHRGMRTSGLPEIPSTSQRGVDSGLLTTYEALLGDFMPPSLLISERHELIHVFGDAGRYLKHRPGRAGRDALELLDSGLRLAVSGAIQQVLNKRKSSVSYRGINVDLDSGPERVELTIRPVAPTRATRSDLLVIIRSIETVVPAEAVESPDEVQRDYGGLSTEQLDAMEAELRYTRENLQATVEELETSNEELQATNEELVASNEELQSTNEELHSVNEELYTVNAEHQRKIQELTVLTDDMDNLLASTRVHTVFLDRELRIRKFTPLAAEIFGLLPHDTGRAFDSFSFRLRHESLNQDLVDVLRYGQPFEADVQDQAGNWLLLRILPYQTRQTLNGVLLTLVDIGQLKRIQHDLSRREFELRLIANHVTALISYVDRDLKYRFVNQRYCELYGKPEHEITGRTMRELQGEVGFAQLLPMIERALNGEDVTFEHRFSPSAGQPFWAIVSYIPDREQSGQPPRGFFVCKNIVTNLKEVEQRFDRAVRGTTDGIWDWNIDSGKVYYSPKFAELLGFSFEHIELVKADVDRRIHPDDLAAVTAAEQALLRDGVPMNVEFRLQCHDGAFRWFRGRAAAQRDGDGRVVYASGSIQDIEDYRILVEQKQRQVEQRDRFLAMLSHELRNPLGAVINSCRLLERRASSSDLMPFVEAISRQSRHMASLLDDLLDVARITEGKIELKRSIVDLREIVPPAVETVRHLLEARRQTVEIELPSAPANIFGDAVRLQQIAANLLSNASKYSPTQSVVRIELECQGTQARLKVIDHGDGIPPEFVRRVFEPFEQLGKKSEFTEGGLGLGLTVAESLVRLHHGTIEVHSEGAGQGSEFVITLPLAEGGMVHGSTLTSPQLPRNSCRIVLIEDNPDAREMLRELLVDDGYEVISADTGSTGLASIEESRPDFAIIDIGLPGMDGYSVARTIRTSGLGNQVFLIALTGFGQIEDRQAALAAGFDAHLTKPVDLLELESLLQSQSSHRPPAPHG
jgi:two-component system CheB/CheR fusion protein